VVEVLADAFEVGAVEGVDAVNEDDVDLVAGALGDADAGGRTGWVGGGSECR
jgi:hypothetical protein